MVLSLSIEEDKDVSVPSLHPNKLNNNEININAFLFIKTFPFAYNCFILPWKNNHPPKKYTKNPKNCINSRHFDIKLKILNFYI